METANHITNARARMFQLHSLAFSHPVPDFHTLLIDGDFARVLNAATAQAVGNSHFVHNELRNYADFEADYITLFQLGRRGKPLVALTAGDHEPIAQGQGRPEFMLAYSAWYKHFGLKINTEENANELPDHLVCQLEFLSWLAHLEETAADDRQLERGYQLAQRDFLQRHVLPFMEVLLTELKKRNSEAGDNPLYLALTAHALESFDSTVAQLDIQLGESLHLANVTDSNSENGVNLWG